MERSRYSLYNLALPSFVRKILPRAPHSHIRFGLSFKLLALVLLISLMGMLALSFLLLNSIKSQFIKQTETAAVGMMATIESSLQHAMLTHDYPMLNSIVERAAANLNGGKIQIFDLQDNIRSSSSTAEIGTRLDRSSPDCQVCHMGSAAYAGQTVKVLPPSQNGPEVLLGATPIHNHPECYACHDPQIATLGVMITRIPLTDLPLQIQEAYRRVGLATLFTFVLLMGLMVYALRIVVIDPIKTISYSISEIATENLDSPIQVDSRDELGELAKSVDTMRLQLKAFQAVRLQRSQELSALYGVASVAGQLCDLQQILSQAVDAIVGRLGLQTGLIYLYNETSQRFERVYSQGLAEWQLNLIDQKRLKDGGDLTGEVAEKGETFFVPDMSHNPHFAGTFDNLENRSYVNIPLKSQGKVVGTLELVGHAQAPLTDHQVRILTIAANQIGTAIDNTSLLKETRQSAREALTLYRLGSEMSASLELDQVFEAIARGACQVLRGDLGVVGLIEPESQEFVVKAVTGNHQGDWLEMHVPWGACPNFDWRDPLAWDQLPANLPEAAAQLLVSEGVNSMLAVPLLRAGQPQGVVAVLSRDRRFFVKEEVHLLVRLAQQVVIAIENARLYQQVRNMAVLEERDRLAREMHDELAQALGFLNLKASLTLEQLSLGEAGQAKTSLEEIKQTARETYINTREAIFNLRNTAPEADMLTFLQDYLAEYNLHYGLDVHLEIDEYGLLEFAQDVTLQINCIIQECLTNIRKHAHASHVWVRLERQGERERIIIQDDGRGFDMEEARLDGQEHFGLQIMTERAESVGARLEVDSQKGRGTRVIIYLPSR